MGTKEATIQTTRGTSERLGVAQRKGVRAVMTKNGISGRLTHACRGQSVGLADSNVLNMSGPRNSRIAKAPYVAQAR